MALCSPTRISCGVYQLHNLRLTPCALLLKRLMAAYKLEAKNNGRRYGFAQVIFSDIKHPFELSPGQRFAKYLKETFPRSELIESKPVENPNSGNQIITYIWNTPKGLTRHKFYKAVRAKEHSNGDFFE